MNSATERFILLFDILGFKVQLERNTLAELATLYSELFPQVLRKSTTSGGPASRCRYLQYSDSVLLYTDGVSPDDLSCLVQAGVYLLAYGLDAGVPLRGTLTRGDVVIPRPDEPQIILGQALAQAYLLEKEQEWVGAVLHPSIEDDAEVEPVLEALQKNGTLFRHRAPMKSGPMYDYLCLGWPLHFRGDSSVDVIGAIDTWMMRKFKPGEYVHGDLPIEEHLRSWAVNRKLEYTTKYFKIHRGQFTGGNQTMA